jgi:hypothetical protein
MTVRIYRQATLGATFTVEVAWGADLTDVAGSGWSWTDITADVRRDAGVTTFIGRGDEASDAQPGTCSLVLDNTSGNYGLSGLSANYPYVRRGTPVRVRIDPGDGTKRLVFQGFATGWSPSWDSLKGNIAVTRLEANGVLRRLQQGAPPVVSPIRRANTARASVKAYWPMEEPAGALQAAPVRGGTNLNGPGSVGWATNSDLIGSAPLPAMSDASLIGLVNPYTDTGSSFARLFLKLPDTMTDGQVLAYFHTTGTLSRFDLTFELVAGVPALGVFVYNRDGTLNTSQIITFAAVTSGVGFQGLLSNVFRFALKLVQSGTTLNWNYSVIDQTGYGYVASGSTFSIASRTAGTISQVTLAPNRDLPEVVMGHVSVEDAVIDDYSDLQAIIGYSGEYVETASSLGRVDRLCSENGIYIGKAGDGSTLTNADRMGPQRAGVVVDLLRDAARVDRGRLFDGHNAGLSLVSRHYTEGLNAAAITLDATSAQLSAPFDIVHDDQSVTNRATVTRTRGATATYSDTTSTMRTTLVGVYDTSEEVNLYSDDYALQHAGWLVSLGTVEGPRYPVVTLDSRRLSASVMAAAAALIPGDRVDVTNVRSVLDWAPADTVSLVVEGIRHDIRDNGWTVSLNCAPFSPWRIARAGSDDGLSDTDLTVRLDTSGATVSSTALVGTTALVVATASGALWTTTSAQFPLDLNVGGLKVTASACSGSTSPQTFTVSALPRTFAVGTTVSLWDPARLTL